MRSRIPSESGVALPIIFSSLAVNSLMRIANDSTSSTFWEVFLGGRSVTAPGIDVFEREAYLHHIEDNYQGLDPFLQARN